MCDFHLLCMCAGFVSLCPPKKLAGASRCTSHHVQDTLSPVISSGPGDPQKGAPCAINCRGPVFFAGSFFGVQAPRRLCGLFYIVHGRTGLRPALHGGGLNRPEPQWLSYSAMQPLCRTPLTGASATRCASTAPVEAGPQDRIAVNHINLCVQVPRGLCALNGRSPALSRLQATDSQYSSHGSKCDPARMRRARAGQAEGLCARERNKPAGRYAPSFPVIPAQAGIQAGSR